MAKVLVYGWYGHGNLGDEAFRPAITGLFPGVDFTFADRLPERLAIRFDAVVFGGGSFLDQAVAGSIDIHLPEGMPIAYLGVSCGDVVHPDHSKLLKKAKLIVVRDRLSFDKLTRIHEIDRNKVHYAGDLVLARDDVYWQLCEQPPSRMVAVFLSDHLTPRRDAPIWAYQAHEWFVREMAKALDRMIDDGLHVSFYAMCVNPRESDERPMWAVTGKMNSDPMSYFSRMGYMDEAECRASIARSHLVVTQRLHGAVFSAALGRHAILINSHDKMNAFAMDSGIETVPYYGFTDRQLLDTVDLLSGSQLPNTDYAKGVKKRWLDIVPIVADKLGL